MEYVRLFLTASEKGSSEKKSKNYFFQNFFNPFGTYSPKSAAFSFSDGPFLSEKYANFQDENLSSEFFFFSDDPFSDAVRPILMSLPDYSF